MRAARFGAVVLLYSLVVWGQGKRPLTFADYETWKAIQSQTLSDDGKFVAYALMPQDGDGEIVVRPVAGGRELRTPAGMQPPRDDREDESGEEGPRPQRTLRLAFTPDGKYLVAQTYPRKSELDEARRAKKKPDEMPKGGVAILDLAGGAVTRIDNVKSFNVGEEGGGHIAYLKDGKEKQLVLSPLSGGSEKTFDGTEEYLLSRDGALVAVATAEAAFVVDTAAGTRTDLKTGKGKYAKFAWDFDQKKLAFLADGAVIGWERGAAAGTEWLKAPAGQKVSERAGLTFTRDGTKLLVGLAPDAGEKKKDEDRGEEKAIFELWHWKDDRVQTIQKVRAEQEKNRSYRAVLHLGEKRLVPLADADVQDVNLSENGRVGLGIDDREYRAASEYDKRYLDVWIVNPANGERKLGGKRLSGQPTLSPDGRWAAYFHRNAWWSLNTETGTSTNLTAHLRISFSNELHDKPSPPTPYGGVEWTKDSDWMVVSDRFDIWAIRPDGSQARNITEGAGRKESISFRIVRPRTDPRERGLDPAQPLLLSAFQEETGDSGFYRDSLTGDAAPTKLVMEARAFSAPKQAKKADVMLLTASRFDEFPDLLVSDSSFAKFNKVSDANPQKKDFLWGTSELISYRNSDGVPLKAVLLKPENFDPKKKYPMLVYIYERLTNGVHAFVDPAPSQNLNRSLYVSNGYLMLYPDIAYTQGYPGESALKCVLAAVQKVADMGIVDEKRIGIQGHSWGGYQIAYMVTRTKRFAAAAPGALVANMTSAYDGVRYGTGLPRQFQYEQEQSRIGGSLWQYPMRYLENSPIFRADLVSTPLLMLHNDRDDAVPFTQGIEFFLALRRLNKEVYFFNYNGEPHGLRKRVNQRDYAMRQFQFFGHFLKDEAKPDWMIHGIRYVDREKPEAQAWHPAPSDAKK